MIAEPWTFYGSAITTNVTLSEYWSVWNVADVLVTPMLDPRARARLALVGLWLPLPPAVQRWRPAAAWARRVEHRRCVVWRGTVGWIRRGSRRPLRGRGR